MTERHPGGLHVQISKLLMAAIVAATAATGALIVTILVDMPPANVQPGPNGMPPPPPPLQALAVFPIVTGFFVLSWLAVLVVFSRDQILRQIRMQQPSPGPGVSRDELTGLLVELQALREQVTEYGERRETDGYLDGMRSAAGDPPREANVRSLRRTPPPR